MSKALLVNVMLVPLLAITLIILVSIEPGYATGLLIIAIAPGAPFGPKLAEIAEGDVPFATSLMAILTVVSVVTIPVTVALFLPSGVSVNPLGIARTVFIVQLLPLFVGLAVKARYESIAKHLFPPIHNLSNYTLVLLIGLLLAVNFNQILSLVGTGTLFVSFVVVGGALILGYVLGGPSWPTKRVLATTTASRNAATALLIATTNFTDPKVVLMVVAFSLVGLIVAGPIAIEWGRSTVE